MLVRMEVRGPGFTSLCLSSPSPDLIGEVR
jgi:hypothetical protein